jgi:hypothetical protein
MGRSIKRNAVDADDESMRPVADIPGDADEGVDLPEISPELVLVDPELARLVRERAELPAASRPLLGPGLRLVPPAESNGSSRPALESPRAVPRAGAAPASPAVEPDEPIVPRPTSSAEPPVLQPTESETVVDATVFEPFRPIYESERPTPEPEALAPAPQRVVDAEPARVVEPERRPEALPQVEPAPLEPEGRTLAAIAPAMPHPLARPAATTRPKRSSRPPRRRRGTLLFLASVAVASLAVLGILNLTGGSSSGSPEATATPASGKPIQSEAQSSNGQESPAAKPKAAAKPKVQTKPGAGSKLKATTKPDATASRPKATTKPKAAVKPSATTKPRATTPRNATTKPKATTTSKAAAKPKASATSGAKAASKPKAPKAAAPEPRRFAWAPVEGAVGYHVELFRGPDRVLAEETKEPVLELGQTWRHEGRVVRLTAGSYRWYVWPVTESGRATQAVVQAKLSVP